jgi:hypothetical protein
MIKEGLDNWRGHSALYRVSPPVEYTVYPDDPDSLDEPVTLTTRYVVAASIVTHIGTAETSVFPVESEDAQFPVGALDLACIEATATHADVLRVIGYQIV